MIFLRQLTWVIALKAVQSMGVEECVARYGFEVWLIGSDHVTRAALGWLHEDAIREDARRSARAALGWPCTPNGRA